MIKKFPVDAPKRKVIKALEKLGFSDCARKRVYFYGAVVEEALES